MFHILMPHNPGSHNRLAPDIPAIAKKSRTALCKN